MKKSGDWLTVIVEKAGQKLTAKAPLGKLDRLVVVMNRQFTNAPNTTQIASGAGRSSASGSNAAIRSPYTKQQESIGAGGKARNIGGTGAKGKPARLLAAGGRGRCYGKEAVIVLNEQIVRTPRNSRNASATQIASGAGSYSSSGTNSAIESPGTKQQQAVGGGTGASAVNKGAARSKAKPHTRSRPKLRK